jgi:hypothetical protein
MGVPSGRRGGIEPDHDTVVAFQHRTAGLPKQSWWLDYASFYTLAHREADRMRGSFMASTILPDALRVSLRNERD